MPEDRDEPRSFRLSHGKSNLGLLLFVVIFGIVIMIAPQIGPWIMRALLVVMILMLLRLILLAHQMPDALWHSQFSGRLSQLCGIAVLGIWIYALVRAFVAGHWLDAGLASLLVGEFTYLAIFQYRHRMLDDDD